MDPAYQYYPYITFPSFALIAFLNIPYSGCLSYRLNRCGGPHPVEQGAWLDERAPRSGRKQPEDVFGRNVAQFDGRAFGAAPIWLKLFNNDLKCIWWPQLQPPPPPPPPEKIPPQKMREKIPDFHGGRGLSMFMSMLLIVIVEAQDWLEKFEKNHDKEFVKWTSTERFENKRVDWLEEWVMIIRWRITLTLSQTGMNRLGPVRQKRRAPVPH